jgi:hypothetical protein
MTGRRVGHIDTAINVLDIERDQSRSRYRGWVPNALPPRLIGANELLKTSMAPVGGVEHRVGLVDGEPV